MLVLAMAASKGGVGRTTLAACLAVEASRQGKRIGLLDLDPQRSLARWWELREGEPELGLGDRPLNLIEAKYIDEAIGKARSEDIEILIIDCPPGSIAVTEQVVALADFVLIPSRPSPLDIEAMDAVVELAREAGVPFAFVLNAVLARSTMTAGARGKLTDLGEVLEEKVVNRQGYAAAMLRGAVLAEVAKQEPPAAEMEALWSAVEKRLRKAEGAAHLGVAS
jgi:chromosome partitioning protein